VRVALVIERFRAAGGGVEQAAYRLVRELARRELELTVFCRQADTAVSAGASPVALGGPRFWQPLRVLEFSRRAARATRGHDVVHSYSRTRRQHIYRAGGGSHAAYLERMYPDPARQRWSPRHRVLLAIEEAVFRDASQLVECNSRRVADEIAARYAVPRERLVTIYNGVDAQHFTPEGREARGGPLRSALRLAIHMYGGSRHTDTSDISQFWVSMMAQMPTRRMASGAICCEKAWTTGATWSH